MKDYKVVVSIEFEDGDEEYVIWEPEFLGSMLYGELDMNSFFYDRTKNGFTKAPVFVKIELYSSPKVRYVETKIGEKIHNRQVLIGNRILPIRTY